MRIEHFLGAPNLDTLILTGFGSDSVVRSMVLGIFPWIRAPHARCGGDIGLNRAPEGPQRPARRHINQKLPCGYYHKLWCLYGQNCLHINRYAKIQTGTSTLCRLTTQHIYNSITYTFTQIHYAPLHSNILPYCFRTHLHVILFTSLHFYRKALQQFYIFT
jgi:hypothetical protein